MIFAIERERQGHIAMSKQTFGAFEREEREKGGHIVISQMSFGLFEREERDREDRIAFQSLQFRSYPPGGKRKQTDISPLVAVLKN